MKAQDIVDKLSAEIPKFTSDFSESVVINSISVSGTTATVTTASAHGLVSGQNVAIIGVKAPVEIDTSEFLRTGSTATFQTLQNHDLTLSELDKAKGGKAIVISGATETEFNDTFTLLDVLNRKKLIIAVTDSGPTTISGSPVVEDAAQNVFNGLFPATNIGATTFDYELDLTYSLDPVVSGAVVQTSIRMLSVLDIAQYLNDVYTKESVGDNQLVVVLGDVTQSKDPNETSDASSSSRGELAYIPRLIQPFAVYIIQNVTDMLSAGPNRDLVESDYVPAIFKSLMRVKFDPGFTLMEAGATFTGHGVFGFADEAGKNKAIYIHEVAFEQVVVLNKDDMADTFESVAMRDVSYTLSTNLGTQELTASVDLDQEPITP